MEDNWDDIVDRIMDIIDRANENGLSRLDALLDEYESIKNKNRSNSKTFYESFDYQKQLAFAIVNELLWQRNGYL